jgi:hypothetical protein
MDSFRCEPSQSQAGMALSEEVRSLTGACAQVHPLSAEREALLRGRRRILW